MSPKEHAFGRAEALYHVGVLWCSTPPRGPALLFRAPSPRRGPGAGRDRVPAHAEARPEPDRVRRREAVPGRWESSRFACRPLQQASKVHENLEAYTLHSVKKWLPSLALFVGLHLDLGLCCAWSGKISGLYVHYWSIYCQNVCSTLWMETSRPWDARCARGGRGVPSSGFV